MYIPPWAHAFHVSRNPPTPTSAREYLATGVFSLVMAAGSAFAGYKLITEADQLSYQKDSRAVFSAPTRAKISGAFLEVTAVAELGLSVLCLMRARRRPDEQAAPAPKA